MGWQWWVLREEMEKLGIEVRFKVKVRARVSSMDGDEDEDMKIPCKIYQYDQFLLYNQLKFESILLLQL